MTTRDLASLLFTLVGCLLIALIFSDSSLPLRLGLSFLCGFFSRPIVSAFWKDSQ